MREPAIHTRRQPSRSTLSSLATGHRKLATVPAFTLTEVLISLAMVSILLIGISRIFALTSQTIGTGQALSTAVRTQRSVQQVISDDFVGPSLGSSGETFDYGGMVRLADVSAPESAAPFLMINNFRVATYLNAQAKAADVVAPAEPPASTTAAISTASYTLQSRQIRGVDLNNDGVENPTSIAAGGEITPIFAYGERNFRCDTLGFFTRGQFKSQTGVSAITTGATAGTATYQGDVEATDSFVWYGHLRIYNSEPGRLDRSNATGAPGDAQTPASPYLPNRNNRFAQQFVLGRMQLLLAEPTDHDDRIGSYNAAPNGSDGGADRKLAEDNTVVANRDPSQPALFLQRKWWDPSSHYIDSNVADWTQKARPLFSPLTINDPVVFFKPDSTTSTMGRNRTVYTSDRTASVGGTDTNYQAFSGRTDIAGMGLKQARARCKFLQQYDLDYPPIQEASAGNQYEWWEKMYVSWVTRFWANPFVATAGFNPGEPNINAKSLAQRQQILSEGCSQFIVEFAGDFVTQNSSTSGTYGAVTRALPDGVLDFVVLPDGSRRTRWYGLPRDADGNGVISTRANDAIVSEDVLPVSVYAGNGFVMAANLAIYGSSSPSKNNSWLPFERIPLNGRGPTSTVAVAPTSNNDYMTNIDEPANATSPDKSSYVCVWGAQDFERTYPDPVDPTQTLHGAVPQLLRLIIDQSDPKQKLKAPVTQELIFPVPNVTGDARR